MKIICKKTRVVLNNFLKEIGVTEYIERKAIQKETGNLTSNNLLNVAYFDITDFAGFRKVLFKGKITTMVPIIAYYSSVPTDDNTNNFLGLQNNPEPKQNVSYTDFELTIPKGTKFVALNVQGKYHAHFLNLID